MGRPLAISIVPRPMARSARCVACLAFVAVLGSAFWAGAAWIGEAVFRWGAAGF